MSKLVYTISDVSGKEGQARLDHYNKWLMDPKRDRDSVYPGYPSAKSKKEKIVKEVAKEVVVETKAKPKAKASKAPAKASKKGSKTAKALEIVKKIGLDKKAECVEAIAAALETSKANANCYFFNASKKLV